MVRFTRAAVLRPKPDLRSFFPGGALILLCLLPIALYLPFMGAPFERDEGTYATIAQGLLDGDVPYRDLFDNKPPLVYGWYAFSFLLFGETVLAPRILAAVLLSLTALAVFAQARMLFARRVAYIATGMFALATGLPFVALHANTEAYMLLPLTASLVAFTFGIRSGRLWWLLLAGALGGIAMMTKQVAVWNVLALALTAALWHWQSGVRGWRLASGSSVVIGGCVAVLALVATPFYAAGALDDLLYANISYNLLYVGFLSMGERLVDLAAGLLFVSLVAAPLVGGGLMGMASVLRLRSPGYVLVVAWALASAIGVATGGRFFPHYFLQVVPALAILTAIVACAWWGEESRSQRLSWSAAAVLPLVAVSLVVNGALYLAPWRTEQRVAPTVFEQKRWEESSRELGAYIAARTQPADTVFNLGREPQIYFYSDRRPAVQYFYDWAYQYDETTIAPTVEALRQARPVYIIDSMQAPLFEPEQRPAEFERLLEEEYEYEGRVYFAELYRLKAAD